MAHVQASDSFFDAFLGHSDGAVFYVTDRFEYMSSDGGLNWSTIKPLLDEGGKYAKAGNSLVGCTSDWVFVGPLEESIGVRPHAPRLAQAGGAAMVRRGGTWMAAGPGGARGSFRMDGRRAPRPSARP